jgi:Domain of unknown function (DUF4167)
VRQGQQNRRGRGRNNNNNNNNNNRKGGHHHNPLSRSFESNGPDVKIRGTPAHIAEKYMTLARDAHSSGDPVLAENYLQHAEHYSRIIMAYREQLNPPGEGVPVMNGNGQRMRMPGEMDDTGGEFGEDDGGDQLGDDGFPQQFQPPMQNQQQPPRHDNNRNNDGNNNRHDRPFRRDRDQQQQGRNRDRYSNDRQDRGDRNGMGDRDRPIEGRPPPPPPAPSQERPPEQAAEGDPRRRDRLPPAHEQPEFLRRPVRRARTETADPGKDDTSRE